MSPPLGPPTGLGITRSLRIPWSGSRVCQRIPSVLFPRYALQCEGLIGVPFPGVSDQALGQLSQESDPGITENALLLKVGGLLDLPSLSALKAGVEPAPSPIVLEIGEAETSLLFCPH